jgi:hypothetical protein
VSEKFREGVEYFVALSRYYFGGIEESHKKWSQYRRYTDQNFNLISPVGGQTLRKERDRE